MLILMILLSTTLTLQAQEKINSGTATKKVSKEIVKPQAANEKVELVKGTPFNSVCPVSGEKLDDDRITASYNGKIYGLCCKKCLAKFTKNPAKYAAKLNSNGTDLQKK